MVIIIGESWDVFLIYMISGDRKSKGFTLWWRGLELRVSGIERFPGARVFPRDRKCMNMCACVFLVCDT